MSRYGCEAAANDGIDRLRPSGAWKAEPEGHRCCESLYGVEHTSLNESLTAFVPQAVMVSGSLAPVDRGSMKGLGAGRPEFSGVGVSCDDA